MIYQGFLQGYKATDGCGAGAWASGDFKKYQNNITVACLRPGDICLDVGANVGYYTLIMSRAVGPQGQVYAFEPVPSTFAYLNQILTETKSTNVKTFQMAVSDSIGEAELIYEKDGDLSACVKGQGIYADDPVSLGKNMKPQCKIKTITMDAIVADNNLKHIDFIKTDCQGADLNILQSSINIIEKFRPKIICEALGNENIHKTKEFFSQIGYYCSCIEAGPSGAVLRIYTEHLLCVPYIKGWPTSALDNSIKRQKFLKNNQ